MKCQLCGTPVTLYSGDEGTNSYISDYDQLRAENEILLESSETWRKRSDELLAENKEMKRILASAGVDWDKTMARAKEESTKEDEDPTPYCSACGAKSRKNCNCGPIAEND